MIKCSTCGEKLPPLSEFTSNVEEVKDEQTHRKVKLNKPLELVALDPSHPNDTVKLGTKMEPGIRQELKQLLAKCPYVFALGHRDMPRIDNTIIRCHLHIDLEVKKVRVEAPKTQ